MSWLHGDISSSLADTGLVQDMEKLPMKSAGPPTVFEKIN